MQMVYNKITLLCVLVACSGCTQAETDNFSAKASREIQKFDKAAERTGGEIKSSVDNFGKGSSTDSGSSRNNNLETNASHAMQTIGKDVELSGHAIGQRINGMHRFLEERAQKEQKDSSGNTKKDE